MTDKDHGHILILKNWLKIRNYGLLNTSTSETFKDCLPLHELSEENFTKLKNGTALALPEDWLGPELSNNIVRTALKQISYGDLCELIQKAEHSYRNRQYQKQQPKYANPTDYTKTGDEVTVPEETLARIKSLIKSAAGAYPQNMFMQKALTLCEQLPEAQTADADATPAAQVKATLLSALQMHLSGSKRSLVDAQIDEALTICEALSPPSKQKKHVNRL